MATLDDQFLWLRQAGFTDIGTWYRYYNFVVFSGTKPLTTSG
jgi:tRNA (cmo5U34)-methyltransferase